MAIEKIHLQSRSVIAVSGDDATDFLQNVFTNDIPKITVGMLQYNLLLAPQGQVLHDVLVSLDGDNRYLIDCDRARSADLLRRLTMFKLRAKVAMQPIDLSVYSAEEGYADPRHVNLGGRIYTDKTHESAAPEMVYNNLCIALGIPLTQTIRYEKDYSHDVNLDLLGAIAWDKGCFIGQEVAARVHNRGLAKKRLHIVEGNALETGNVVDMDGNDIGEIRTVNETTTQGLAVLKLLRASDQGRTANGHVFQIRPLS